MPCHPQSVLLPTIRPLLAAVPPTPNHLHPSPTPNHLHPAPSHGILLPSPQAEFDELGQRTDGFSGSDIAVVVKDVLMQPVRKTQARGGCQWVPGLLVPALLLLLVGCTGGVFLSSSPGETALCLADPYAALQDATHFRRTNDPQTGKEVLEPCSPGEQGAFAATLQVGGAGMEGWRWHATGQLRRAALVHCHAKWTCRRLSLPGAPPLPCCHHRRLRTRGWRGWCTRRRSRSATLKRCGGRCHLAAQCKGLGCEVVTRPASTL